MIFSRSHFIVFLFALTGILLTLHIEIQQRRGFPGGCWGLAPAKAAALSDAVDGCRKVAAKDPLHAVGLSLSMLGFAHWSVVALLLLGSSAAPGVWRTRGARWGCNLVLIAAAGSVGLVASQLRPSASLCALCLLHGGLTLAAAAFAFRARSCAAPSAAAAWAPIPPPYQIGLFGFVLSGVALSVFVNRIGLASLKQEGRDAEVRGEVRALLEQSIDPGALRELAPCGAGLDKVEAIAFERVVPAFLSERLGYRETAEMVVYYDPACPGCAALKGELEIVKTRLSGRINILYLPAQFYPESGMAVQALWIARREGRDEELRRAFQEADRSELFGRDELAALMQRSGFHAQQWMERIAKGEGLAEMRDMKRHIDALAIDAVPAVYLYGKQLPRSMRNFSASCLLTTIESFRREKNTPKRSVTAAQPAQ